MKLTKAQRLLLSSSLSVFLVGCGSPNYSQSEMHMTVEEADSTKQVKPSKIPALVKASPTAPVPSAIEDTSTFDVVVTSVPVRDLLFALARDAGVNMDIDDEVGGYVSISALDQTLDAILTRIGEQVAIRIDYVGDAIIIKPDKPFYKHYQVDFLNIERTYSSNATTGGVGNTGTSSVSNSGAANFWSAIEASLDQILSISYSAGAIGATVERNLRGASGGSAIADTEFKTTDTDNSYNLNPDTGVLIVFAPQRLQKEVQEMLDRNLSIAKRQVLLEATIVEVVLNNQYAQGIDWSLFNSLATEGLALYQGGTVGGAASALEIITRELEVTQVFDAPADALAALSELQSDPLNTLVEYTITTEEGVTTLEYTVEALNENATAASSGGLVANNANPSAFFTGAYRNGDISAAVQLLDTFGDAKVLSSPRISALNHQPALLRVVDQEVYFNFTVEEEVNENTGQSISRSLTVEENTVDVGFSMNVFPHISDDGEIILNLKPAVTRVLDYRQGPVLESFGAAGGSVQNLVPVTRVRELESLISLRDGEIAVLGGLLEDRTADNNSSVPGLSRLPGVGALFERTDETTFKTEFVVFIRAKIINNPSINGDYSGYRHLLPNSDFIIRDTESTLLPPTQRKTR